MTVLLCAICHILVDVLWWISMIHIDNHPISQSSVFHQPKCIRYPTTDFNHILRCHEIEYEEIRLSFFHLILIQPHQPHHSL